MTGQDWPVATDARDFLRQLNRRLTIQERRAAATSARDLVGPGIAARAIQITDWNDETTTFNGFFYSTPGALHTPEPGFEWNGYVVARGDGSGTQTLTNPQGTATFLQYSRTFKQHPLDPTVVVFGPWKQFLTATGTIGAPQLDEQIVTDISDALEQAAEAIAFQEASIWVFRQPTAPVPGSGLPGIPTTFQEGYVWYDTDDSNHMRVWHNGAWAEPDYGLTEDQQEALDQAIADAAAALAAAQDAVDAAESANHVYYQTAQPAVGTLGDGWYDTDDGNRYRIYNGSAWVDPMMTLVGATMRYPANAGTGSSPTVIPGVVLGSGGLGLYDNLGATVFMNAATGAATFRGAVSTGGSLTGAIVTGGTIQTESTALRGIKMTSTGMIGYSNTGVPTFSYVAATGAVTLKGSLTSGSTISGALITGVLETDPDPGEGIKISNSGLFVYDSATNEVVLSADNLGNLELVGAVSTGGSINGAVITGATIQTSDESDVGIKLTDTGLVAHNDAGEVVFVLSADSGNVTLAGGVIAGGEMVGTTFMTSSLGTGARVYISDEASIYAFVRLDYGYGDDISDQGGVGVNADVGYVTLDSGKYDNLTSSSIHMRPGSGTGTIDMNGTVKLNRGMNVANLAWMPNEGNPAGGGGGWRNMMVSTAGSSSGNVRLSTSLSSLRYKKYVDELDVGEAVLNVSPVTFEYKVDAPIDENDLGIRHKGLISEYLHEAGLTQWVHYDDEGRPDEVDYYNWSLAVHSAVRFVNQKFEEKFAALEDRLAAAGI